ncbi:membrane hypothetical protein [Candidatus Sulfopaludibacter sp. SbA4]|nr:membrane hypothetical protein [Candidatus Sulfopaludibacter sp. SbA4]
MSLRTTIAVTVLVVSVPLAFNGKRVGFLSSTPWEVATLISSICASLLLIPLGIWFLFSQSPTWLAALITIAWTVGLVLASVAILLLALWTMRRWRASQNPKGHVVMKDCPRKGFGRIRRPSLAHARNAGQ